MSWDHPRGEELVSWDHPRECTTLPSVLLPAVHALVYPAQYTPSYTTRYTTRGTPDAATVPQRASVCTLLEVSWARSEPLPAGEPSPLDGIIYFPLRYSLAD